MPKVCPLMHQKDLKKLWLVGNAGFILIYTLTISTYIIRVPFLHKLPRQIICSLLAFIYGLTLYQVTAVDPLKVLEQSNFYCILLFLTFPHRFLLFPFFMLAAFNTSKTITENRKKYQNAWFYPMAATVREFDHLIPYAHDLQIIMCLLSLFLFFMRQTSFLTFVAYCLVVSGEIKTNPEMKKAVVRVSKGIDDLIDKLPDNYKEKMLFYKNTIFKRAQLAKSKAE